MIMFKEEAGEYPEKALQTVVKDGQTLFKKFVNWTPAEYDADGELILASTGYASSVSMFDNVGRLTEVSYLDTEGRLIKIINGYAKVTYEYYRGTERVHFERYFGADGQRTMTVNGRYIRGYICPDYAKIAADETKREEEEAVRILRALPDESCYEIMLRARAYEVRQALEKYSH
jgi:hypothetical protein